MQWQDVYTLIEGALEQQTQQHRRDENTAMLLDRLNFYLESEYSSWITDPNDPAVKADQAERKRRGITPPPRPLIQPIAHRPNDLAEQHMQYYSESAERYSKPISQRGLTVAEVLKMRKG